MILIGVGSNLTSTAGGPLATCKAALARLEAAGLMIVGCSLWYETAPVPVSDQPWFVNAVAEVATDRDPAKLLAVLHDGENVGLVEFVIGRVGLVGLDAINEFVLAQEFAAARLCSGGRGRIGFLEGGYDATRLPHASRPQKRSSRADSSST